jgi:crotonobetaine/carnitine-CoA ligase
MTVGVVGNRTIPRVIDYNGEHYGRKVFIEDGEIVLTYATLARYINQLGNTLQHAGLKRGDHVLVFMPNSAEYLLAVLAILRIGCVYVTCSTHYKDDEIAYQVEHSEAVAVVTDLGSQDRISAIIDACPDVRHVLSWDMERRLDVGQGSLNAGLRESSINPPATHPDADDPAMIFYTSGTTARPKGVMFSQGNFYLAGRQVADALQYRHEDRVLHHFALYHAQGGISMVAPPLVRGATIVIQPRFSASRFGEIAVMYRITITAMNATHVKMVLAHPTTSFDRRTAMSRIQFGLPLDMERRQEFEERFEGTRLIDAYGLTEGNGISTCSPIDALRRPGSIGAPLPAYELRIAGPAGDELPPGMPGEIGIKSLTRHGLSLGYYRDPANTAALFDGEWLRTGDLGHLDEEGNLYFLERAKDTIKRSGLNVASAEVERVVMSHAGVAEVAVVGIPDPVREEAIVAFVVLKGDRPVTEAEIIAHATEYLADYKVPQHVAFVDALPENFVGKVEKKRLRDRATELFGST